MLSDADIERAKKDAPKTAAKKHHEHNDCIRIAYEWLDAQVKTKKVSSKYPDLKHMIEGWAGRYISRDDVQAAAHLHPEIRGTYPNFNISSRRVLPSERRLEGIGEAGKHPGYLGRFASSYKETESKI